MFVDLNVYKINKLAAQRLFLSKDHGNIDKAISTIAIVTGCPCIVVAYWLGEIAGWETVEQQIKTLKQFYGYIGIINAPPDCPYK